MQKGRRQTTTGARALAAASRILREDGYARLTMERVAAESKVAKTTLYRRWPTKAAVERKVPKTTLSRRGPTKAALCLDLYLDVADRELEDPATGDVARDLKRIASAVVYPQTPTVRRPALL